MINISQYSYCQGALVLTLTKDQYPHYESTGLFMGLFPDSPLVLASELVVYLDYDGRMERHFPHDIDPEVLRVLELAGYDRRIYTENPYEKLSWFFTKCELYSSSYPPLMAEIVTKSKHADGLHRALNRYVSMVWC